MRTNEDVAKLLMFPTTTVEKAGQILGLGRSASYEAVARGDIPILRFGRRIVVPTAKLREMLGIKDQQAAA